LGGFNDEPLAFGAGTGVVRECPDEDARDEDGDACADEPCERDDK